MTDLERSSSVTENSCDTLALRTSGTGLPASCSRLIARRTLKMTKSPTCPRSLWMSLTGCRFISLSPDGQYYGISNRVNSLSQQPHLIQLISPARHDILCRAPFGGQVLV